MTKQTFNLLIRDCGDYTYYNGYISCSLYRSDKELAEQVLIVEGELDYNAFIDALYESTEFVYEFEQSIMNDILEVVSMDVSGCACSEAFDHDLERISCNHIPERMVLDTIISITIEPNDKYKFGIDVIDIHNTDKKAKKPLYPLYADF